jgi:soluble lytic murein transglycosylase
MARLKEAVKQTDDQEYGEARAALAKIADPAAKKLALWYLMRANSAGMPYAEVLRFRQENPLWPAKDTLDAGMETGLLLQESNPAKVLALFAQKPPSTSAGKAALAGAMLATGDTARGKAMLREVWHRSVLERSVENWIGDRFDSHLTEADHRERLHWLEAKGSRKLSESISALREKLGIKDTSSGKAAGKIARLKKSLGARLAKAKEKAKQVALAVTGKPKWSGPHLALKKEIRKDSGAMLAKAKELRKRGEQRHAWSLLRSIPGTAIGRLEAPDWWEERRQHVRAALNAGYPKTAYEIARNHGLLTQEYLSEAEFLAGWIALRFLNKPAGAREHFTVCASAGGLPKDRARASYWMGRAELALHHKEPAQDAFREAAQYGHVFYGQLAQEALGSAGHGEFRAPYRPDGNEISSFVQQDVARAFVIAKKAELNSALPAFLFELARSLDNPADMTLTAELASRLAALPTTVRFAKIALNRGFAVEYYAYPGDAAVIKRLTKDSPVEAALILALTRQESEFNTGTVSSAGARGLMQLMPATARQLARDTKMKYDVKKISEPEINMTLGSEFLRRLLGNYDGSYIITLAAYNAGPGRVREWGGQFGDPRTNTMDPIDWIERIPFVETHDYVHKIMESLQLYRMKTGAQKAKLQLIHDLNRGRTQSFMQSRAN